MSRVAPGNFRSSASDMVYFKDGYKSLRSGYKMTDLQVATHLELCCL